MKPAPTLHVEGNDDISVINALLFRHGVDTARGNKFLRIQGQGSDVTLLANMADAIRNATDQPVGFVLDIDVKCSDRWSAVCGALREFNLDLPNACPETGYFGKLSDYPHRFGVWLMPDCATDYTKLEHLCQTLLPHNDPLWPHVLISVTGAVTLVNQANVSCGSQPKWSSFKDADRIKAEIHTWLAWQQEPGKPMGAAINAHFLNHDSAQAMSFLRWIKELYGMSRLAVT